jgi:hypothetical protein
MTNAHSAKFASRSAVAATLIAVVAFAPSAAAFDSSDAWQAGLELAGLTKVAIFEGYRAAPALMLGLAAAFVLPIVAVLARFSRPLAISPDVTRRYRPDRDDEVDADLATPPTNSSGHPFVEVVSGNSQMRCTILGDMLRIGREDDNDIRIPSSAVHRYHAAIHREDYDDWHITDLSGVEGNGLIINGRRCHEARLHDGDLIQLGPGRLRFRAGFA